MNGVNIMKITALVENQSKCELKPNHGLSLYIETPRHKILFDLGPDNTLFSNSKARDIDLTKIDTVIISHGHMDHGGALKEFLNINKTAKIYVQRSAFDKHYSRFLFFNISVDIDQKLADNAQIVLVDGDYQIDDELTLFTVPNTSKCYSNANDSLYTDNGKDNFSHEHNLLIQGEHKVLIMGCGHAGVVNIMEKASDDQPELCIGGFHLFNPMKKKTVSNALLDTIANELSKYHTTYYTCHCTGTKAFTYLSQRIPDMHYLSCGEAIVI